MFPQHYPFASVAGTAWLVFVELGQNPFAARIGGNGADSCSAANGQLAGETSSNRNESTELTATRTVPEFVQLSIGDCLVKAIANHPDLHVTELAGRRAASPEGERLAVKLSRPLQGNTSNAASRRVALCQRVSAVMYDTEEAYWDLVHALQTRQVRQGTLERARAYAQSLKRRAMIDATEYDVRFAEAALQAKLLELSFATEAVAAAEDRLKLLMNDPRLAVDSKVTIRPTTKPPMARVYVDLQDQIRLALRRRVSPAEGDETKVDRARLGHIILEVKCACRGIEASWDRIAFAAKREEELVACLKALKDSERLGARFSLNYTNERLLVEEHLTAARLSTAKAKVAYAKALPALSRACGSHERSGLKLELVE